MAFDAGPSTDHDSRQIVTTRVFDRPRERVWEAWANPKHLAQWWGPKGFTNTFHEFDLRPGGHWRFVMHGPDGTDYKNHSVFLQVLKPDLIVFEHLDPVHTFEMTVLFSEQAGKTQLTWHMLFESVAHCDAVRDFVIQANEENFDRLDAELSKMERPI